MSKWVPPSCGHETSCTSISMTSHTLSDTRPDSSNASRRAAARGDVSPGSIWPPSCNQRPYFGCNVNKTAKSVLRTTTADAVTWPTEHLLNGSADVFNSSNTCCLNPDCSGSHGAYAATSTAANNSPISSTLLALRSPDTVTQEHRLLSVGTQATQTGHSSIPQNTRTTIWACTHATCANSRS